MNSAESADEQVYVVGDVHGDLVNLRRQLWARGLLRGNKWRKGDHLICVGDYTDRNRGGLEVLRLLRPLEEQGQVTCLLGNHDVVMLATALLIRRYGGLPPSYQPGTPAAQQGDEESIMAWLFVACGAFIEEAQALAGDEVMLAWLRRQPLVTRRADLLVVHADSAQPLMWGRTVAEVNLFGRRVTEGENLSEFLALYTGLTNRYAFASGDGTEGPLSGDHRGPKARAAAPELLDRMLAQFGGRVLVHGHSVFNTADAKPLIYAAGRAVNVDRGAGYAERGGKLCLTSYAELVRGLG